MLGEDHSLVADFPELKAAIMALDMSDAEFREQNKRYSELDREIRTLELKEGPIGDEQMHQLKHERALLKDLLYQKLVTHKSTS